MKGYRMKTTNTKLIFMLLLGVLTGQSALFGAGAAGAGPGAGRESSSEAEFNEIINKIEGETHVEVSKGIAISISSDGQIFARVAKSIVDPTVADLFARVGKTTYTLMHVFANNGDIDRLTIVLKSYRKIKERPEYFAKLNSGTVEWINKYYPTFDVLNPNGETPLMLALANGHLEIANYLFNQGATFDHSSFDGLSIEQICQRSSETKKWLDEKAKIAAEQSKRLAEKHMIKRLSALMIKRLAEIVSAESATGKDVAPTHERKPCAGPGAGMRVRRKPKPKKEPLPKKEPTRMVPVAGISETQLRKQRKAANKIARELEAQKAVLKAEEDAKKESERKAKSAKRAALNREIGELSEAMKLLEKTSKKELRQKELRQKELRQYEQRLEQQRKAEEAAKAAREAAEKAAQEAKAKEDARIAHEAVQAAAKAAEDAEHAAQASLADITSRLSSIIAPAASPTQSLFMTEEELKEKEIERQEEEKLLREATTISA
jgi:hypothetical protein